MKYEILSPRVGIPGDEYEPAEGVNVEALIDGGFIKSTNAAPKGAKTKTDTNKE